MKLIRSKRFIKAIAVFFLLTILNTIVFPTVSYALTAGPTAPEFSSFEPVDTTDMVNLVTGDFTYNIPLLEVPGPEGGYPLALSYHAGIQPDEEASWVGLGWTLNPGAINRTVNGFPDDYKAIASSVYDYWKGGETEAFSIGVSTGLGYAGANFGLTFSNDTYQGFGVGWNYGVGLSYGIAEGMGGVHLGIGANVDPYGGSYSYAGANIGMGENDAANLGVGFNVTSEGSLSGSVGLSNGSFSLIGASIGSNSMKPSLSTGGASFNQVNSNAGNISSYSYGIGIAFPIPTTPLWFNLGYNYTRYWSAENSFVDKYGSLYYPQNFTPEYQTFDTYSIIDSDDPNSFDKEVDKQYGGSLPSYDQYVVSGQGVGGSIQPYILDNINLFKQNRNKWDEDDEDTKKVINYYNTGYVNQKKVNFRFVNDFSNSYTRNSVTNPTGSSIATLLAGFDSQVNVNNTGFEPSDNHLAGSRHIEWFTNKDLVTSAVDKMGLVIPEGDYSNRQQIFKSYNVSDQIGAFMIINESGVTYHYAQPVYTYDEFSKYEAFDGSTYRTNTNPHAYAYTWLLTAITGPDYVDRGLPGPDKDDWGYWVEFEYGKWTDAYQWRNPSTGFHKDLGQESNFYSRGKKELYYLDAVMTRTHTALFEKEMREDGKGVSDEINGGSNPKETTILSCSGCTISGDSKSYTFPVASLKLNNVYLFKNEELERVLSNEFIVNDLGQLKAKSNILPPTFAYSGSTDNGMQASATVTIPHYYNNVLDSEDLISALESFQSASLRTINLRTEYLLTPGTDNSFPNSSTYQKYPVIPQSKGSKLTLTGVNFRGKGNANIIPPVTFEYNKPSAPYNRDHFDIWGVYKSDYVGGSNENISRQVTTGSASNVDSWSLSKIYTGLGSEIEIKYESDEYDQVVFSPPRILRVTDAWPEGATGLRVKIHDEDAAYLNSLASGSTINLDFVAGYKISDFDVVLEECDCLEDGELTKYRKTNWKAEFRRFNASSSVVSVDVSGKSILVYNAKIACPQCAHQVPIFDAGNNIEINRQLCCQRCDLLTPWFLREWGNCKFRFNGSWPNFIVGGSVSYNVPVIRQKGGGLRVRSLSVKSSDSKVYSTNYLYSGGRTSYLPLKSIPPYFNPAIFDEDNARVSEQNIAKTMVRASMEKHMYGFMSKVNEIPPPGVIYSEVTVKESVNINNQDIEAPGYKKFNFSTFNMSGLKPDYSRSAPSAYNSVVKTRKITLKDFSNRIGNLLQVSTYDKNDNLINKITNTYLHDIAISNAEYETLLSQNYASQGKIDQVFHEYRVLDELDSWRQDQLVLTRKEEFPLVLIRQEKKNYKTGITEVAENLAFDFYSGQVTEVMNTDAFGNQFITFSEAAYHHYPSMGLRISNPTNKHMLVQNSLSLTYKVDNASDLNPIGLVSASVQTWSNQVPVNGVGIQPEVWRKMSSWSWIGDDNMPLREDGTYSYTTFQSDVFDWTTGLPASASSFWQKNGDITLYDVFSHGLEAKDINNNFAATLMDIDNKEVIATVSNAQYHEMAYSGAEYYRSGESVEGRVNQMDGIPSTEHAHAGNRSLQVNPGDEGFRVILQAPSRKYRASVWVYFAGESQQNLNNAELYYQIGSSIVPFSPVEAKKSKNWYLITFDFSPQGTDDVIIGCRNTSGDRSLYFDDFRVHPLDAPMISYAYDSNTGELTHILDADNFYTKFEYDEMGRLKRTYKEFFNVVDKKVSEQHYHYKKPLADW